MHTGFTLHLPVKTMQHPQRACCFENAKQNDPEYLSTGMSAPTVLSPTWSLCRGWWHVRVLCSLRTRLHVRTAMQESKHARTGCMRGIRTQRFVHYRRLFQQSNPHNPRCPQPTTHTTHAWLCRMAAVVACVKSWGQCVYRGRHLWLHWTWTAGKRRSRQSA